MQLDTLDIGNKSFPSAFVDSWNTSCTWILCMVRVKDRDCMVMTAEMHGARSFSAGHERP
jgi:hypothetical protein